MDRRLGLAAAVAAALLLPACGREGKVHLRLRLEDGKTYFQDMEMDQVITQTAGGTEMAVEQSMGMGSAYRVEGVDAGGAMGIRCTFAWASMRQKGPMGTLDYDSRNPPAKVPLAARGFAALVGREFRFEWSPSGAVARVEGMGAAFEEMVRGMDIPDEALRASLVEGLRSQFGDDALKDMLEKAMRFYPEGPVGKGDTWTATMELRKPMALTLESTYRLLGRKDGVCVIEAGSRLTCPGDAPPLSMGPVKVRYRVQGTQSGRMEVDEGTGWILSSTVEQDLSGAMEVEGGGMDPVPMRMKGTIRIAGRK